MTGACAEVVILDTVVEPDYDRPIPQAELTTAYDERTRALKPGERVEVDLVGNDEFDV
ncbi:MAG TPA: hypothetical protein VFA37_10805 [Gaiellaceae bacterium]|nr:hypothetical protein [Gaiellaceae bacterium]